MKVTVNDAEKSQKELSVEIPYAKYEELFEQEYNKIKPNVKIPGFRQGKAPRDLIIKEYKHRISVNALEKLVNDTVQQSIISNNITPLNTPSVKDVKFEEGEPITFKIYVDVYPEVKVEKYKGYDFVKEIEEVKQEDINNVLEQIRQKNTSFEPAEDGYAIQNGDMAVIDFVGKVDGEVFAGGSATDQSIVVGSNTFLKDFEDGVIGMKKGETKAVDVQFPDNYHEKSLAGKVATFDITVKEVKKKSVPEINDDFAKDVDEDCETLEDLKKKVEEDLKQEVDMIAKEKLYDDILKKLIEENPFEIPESMVEEQAYRLADQTLQQYQYMYGVSPEALGLDRKSVAESMKDRAEFQIKGALILNKIAETESIKVEEADVDAKIREVAEKMKKDFEEYKKELVGRKVLSNVENNVLTEKIFDFLIKENKVEEKIVDRKKEAEEKSQKEESAE